MAFALLLLAIFAVIKVAHHFLKSSPPTREPETEVRNHDGIDSRTKREFCVDCVRYNRCPRTWVRVGSLCSHCFHKRKQRKEEIKKVEPKPVCIHCHNWLFTEDDAPKYMASKVHVPCDSCLWWVCTNCQEEHTRVCYRKNDVI